MPPPILQNSSAYCWFLLLALAGAVLAAHGTPPTTKSPPPAHCTYAEHACSNGRCVPLHRYCDGRNDCGDGSDEPRYCTKCNRTYYGVVGRTYDLELHRPKEDKIPFVCDLTFTAAGGQFGDLIQVTFDSFTLGRFVSFTGDGCPDGSLQIVESGRPRVGGAWCGTTWGPAVYYSETDSVTLHVQLLKLSKVENGYNFDYRMEYKFLKRKSATVRYGGGVPSVILNSSSSLSFTSVSSSLTSPEPFPLPPEPPEPEPEYYLGDLISGTYCSRIFSDCDRKHCRLQSPNFPGIYPRNLTCYYAVRQHEIPPGKHALITVRQPKGQLIQIRSESALHGTASTHELRVWESCDDVQDYVVIYDGYTTRDPVILKFCGGGEPVPKTVSSGHELLVEFSTSPYGTFLQPSPPKSLHGFQLEVEVEFVDQQAPSYMRQKKNCEFWVRGTDKGVIESPVHSLPANTTCLYHFQGLDAAVSPSPVPYRPMNVRYPDWRHMGMILPPPRYRVWFSVVKFHAGGSWDPKQTEQVCRSYLNVWDGQLWTPSSCDGLYCGTTEKPRGRSGSSIATGKKNVTLLARYCKERVPKSCEHSLLANDTRYPRPCSIAESFLTSGDSLTLELKLADSTALRPVTFKALYEFVDLHVDGEPFGEGPCSRKFGYTTSNKVPEEGINTSSEEDKQQKFRSPRDVFLYGRGGARNLSCVYRFESPPDLRVKLTLTSVTVLRRRCETRASSGRLECVGETMPSATVSLHERPWPDVPPVQRHCLCRVRSETLLPFTYVSASNVVEIRFDVVGMNASDDFDTLSFEGTWKFIKTPSCSKELRYKGASGQLIFTHPPYHTEANCESNPRVIVPSSNNKYLYVKIKGLIMEHSSRMGNNTIRRVNTGQRCDIATRIIVHTALYTAVICPTPNSYRDHLVEVFSEGWHLKSDQNHVIIGDLALDKLEIDRLGKELPRTIVVEFYGKEEGQYVVNWLELTRRRDTPPNGLGLFLMKADDCRYRCPELDACINPSVWCDGIEDCPSGVDEALSHCSVLLNLPPLYLALGISGLIVAFIASVLMTWRACKRRRPRSILQTRLKSLSSSDTGIVDEKGIIC